MRLTPWQKWKVQQFELFARVARWRQEAKLGFYAIARERHGNHDEACLSQCNRQISKLGPRAVECLEAAAILERQVTSLWCCASRCFNCKFLQAFAVRQ